MKKILALIVIFVCVTSNAQDLKIVHINAVWNQNNNYKYINDLNGVEIQYGYLKDQAPSIKKTIKAVPTLILIKNGRAVYVWNADISLKLKINPEEIQKIINLHRAVSRRQSTE